MSNLRSIRIWKVLPESTAARVLFSVLPGTPGPSAKTTLLTRDMPLYSAVHALVVAKTGENLYIAVRPDGANQDLARALRLHLETGWPVAAFESTFSESAADTAHHAALAETDQTRIG